MIRTSAFVLVALGFQLHLVSRSVAVVCTSVRLEERFASGLHQTSQEIGYSGETGSAIPIFRLEGPMPKIRRSTFIRTYECTADCELWRVILVAHGPLQALVWWRNKEDF